MLGYKRLESVLDELHEGERQQKREARVRAQLDEVRAELADLDAETTRESAPRDKASRAVDPQRHRT